MLEFMDTETGIKSSIFYEVNLESKRLQNTQDYE